MASDRTVFVAGATGAIGSILCRMLVADAWQVHGISRSQAGAARLRALGVMADVVDVFDRVALTESVGKARPSVVVHQLTDLPKIFTPEALAEARPRNARIREAGTANLVAAARDAGATRIVAQSLAFAYVPGPAPYDEASPLDRAQYPSVARLEEQVLQSGLFAVVLRYGRLYGPGTWTNVAPEHAPVHVEAAAEAARLAMTSPHEGIFNIAEDGPDVTSTRARRDLSWSSSFRLAG